MEKNKDLVSICIPTFNGEEFISAALQSAISQTYSNLEIIISDDASIDSTLKIIENLKLKTSIPIFIYNNKPSGIGANWNNCISKSNGNFIKFLFQDDVLEKQCVEKMINEIKKDKKIALVYSKRKIFYDKNNNYHLKWLDNYISR